MSWNGSNSSSRLSIIGLAPKTTNQNIAGKKANPIFCLISALEVTDGIMFNEFYAGDRFSFVLLIKILILLSIPNQYKTCDSDYFLDLLHKFAKRNSPRVHIMFDTVVVDITVHWVFPIHDHAPCATFDC